MNQDNRLRFQIRLGFSDILHARRLYRTAHSDFGTLCAGLLIGLGLLGLLGLMPFFIMGLMDKGIFDSIFDSVKIAIGSILFGLVAWLDSTHRVLRKPTIRPGRCCQM